MHAHHSSFIPSSADGRLGCVHVLAIVHRAAVNVGVHGSFQMSFRFECFSTFGIYTRVKLLGHRVALFLVF